MSNYREELTQIAAVAVAIQEDDITGEGALGEGYTQWVLDKIAFERLAQNEKWGPQHHEPFVWLMILMEEVGEWAEEIEAPVGYDYPFAALVRDQIIHAGQRAKAFLEYQPL